MSDFVAVKLTPESKKEISTTAIVCMAEILDIDGDLAEVKFMVATRSGTLYTWPEKEDLSWQPLDDVLCVVQPPELVNQRAQFQFAAKDMDDNKMMFKSLYFK